MTEASTTDHPELDPGEWWVCENPERPITADARLAAWCPRCAIGAHAYLSQRPGGRALNVASGVRLDAAEIEAAYRRYGVWPVP